ncbi:MAG: hypothetical protein HQK81_04085 [Desulfovibrionaceae bacterium]|nr:hypothetical protein [Desulfovibrionaceae bacterium]MBF0513223.1 hypothetical protein [Desulfovibrionaceae bacterium]
MAWSSIESVVSPLSGNTFIDSLVDPSRITYNYELPQKGYLDYTFNTASNVAAPNVTLQTMTSAQQQAVTNALNYIGSVSGITFKQQSGQTADDLVFGYDPKSPATNAGVDYSSYTGAESNGVITGLTLNDTITLNPNDPQQTNPVPGTDGYLTVLHEVGHALGLKHPFQGAVVLPNNIDNTNYTVMSYNNSTPYPTSYGPIDIAALRYLYGGDGLLGQYGLTVNTSGAPVSSLAPNVNDTLVGFPGVNGPVISSESSSDSSYQVAALGSAGSLNPTTLTDSAGLAGATTPGAFVNSQACSGYNGSYPLLAQGN